MKAPKELIEKYNKRGKWNGKLPRWVYCKYCYKNVKPEIGDGIVVCSECGYGLAPLDEVEEYGGYNAFKFHIEVDFIRFQNYYDEVNNNKREANGIDEFGIVPYICPICKKGHTTVNVGDKEYCNDCDPNRAKREANLASWRTPEGIATRKRMDEDYERRKIMKKKYYEDDRDIYHGFLNDVK